MTDAIQSAILVLNSQGFVGPSSKGSGDPEIRALQSIVDLAKKASDRRYSDEAIGMAFRAALPHL